MISLSPKTLRRLSACMTALVLAPAVVYATRNHIQHQEQLGCLAKNVYYEARGEDHDSQKVVAYVTLARTADHRGWGKTPCETVYQKIKGVPQFSWTPYAEGPSGPQWERAQAVAKAVYTEGVAAVPKKFKCARYYKRTDNAGVSERSKKYFATLKTVDTFGHHTAYCDR